MASPSVSAVSAEEPAWVTTFFPFRDIDAVREVYREIYQGPIVHFDPEADEDGFLSASKYAGYDDMEITVNGNSERIVLTARYDNLGKGACGAAIQNMNLVLGIDETTGLNLKTI